MTNDFHDGGVLLLTLAATAATLADIESTISSQRDPEAAEVNSWVYGERPGRLRMYAVNLPATLLFMRLAYRWKEQYAGQRGSWIWRFPLIAATIGHSVAAFANYYNFSVPQSGATASQPQRHC